RKRHFCRRMRFLSCILLKKALEQIDGRLVRQMKTISTSKCVLICALSAVAALAEGQEQGKTDNPPAAINKSEPISVNKSKFGIVIHGGAGTMERDKMTPQREQEYRAGLARSLQAGFETLQPRG